MYLATVLVLTSWWKQVSSTHIVICGSIIEVLLWEMWVRCSLTQRIQRVLVYSWQVLQWTVCKSTAIHYYGTEYTEVLNCCLSVTLSWGWSLTLYLVWLVSHSECTCHRLCAVDLCHAVLPSLDAVITQRQEQRVYTWSLSAVFQSWEVESLHLWSLCYFVILFSREQQCAK